MSTWTQTFRGHRFDPMDPDGAHIDALDIAHALGNLCRYGGHTSSFCSVAQHSVLMSRALERDGGTPREQRWALGLHP